MITMCTTPFPREALLVVVLVIMSTETVVPSLQSTPPPANMFTFDPAPYSANAYHGTVCLSDQLVYTPACVSEEYDPPMDLGMRSSRDLNDDVKWDYPIKKHDNKSFTLSVPISSINITNETCLTLDLPMDASIPAPVIYITWLCRCSEINHTLCLSKKLFAYAVPTNQPSMSLKRRTEIIYASTVTLNKKSIAFKGTLGFRYAHLCNSITTTVPLPMARSVMECLHFCRQFSKSNNGQTCFGFFFWTGSGQCAAVISYSKSKTASHAVSGFCEYVVVKG